MVVPNSSSFAPRSRVQTLLVLFAGLLGVAVVGEIDSRTGPELALSVIYLLPVGVSAWLGGRPVGLFVAFFAAVVWTFYDMNQGRPYDNQFIPYWNGAVRFLIFVIMAVLLDIVRRLTDGLHALVHQRTAALETEIQNRKEVERIATEISAHEQQRLGADLHDQLAGHLTGLAFHAKALAETLERRNEPESPAAQQLVTNINQALRQLRAFCRLLAPIDTGNLEPGLTRLGAQIESAFGVTCVVQTPKEPPHLGLNRARLIYNITQEAVRTAVEKRMAKHVEIHLEQEGSLLKLAVIDNGEPVKEPVSPADADLDVRVMRYRAETLGGQISVGKDGQGRSTLVCTVPIERETTPFPPMT
jgi:signal transduction histidine kinase